MNNNDMTVQKLIDESAMSRLQIVVVAIAVALNALDGFDLLSISFAAPGIANEWNISRAALGVVLSMELIGMGIGSLCLGGAADRFGRRPTILFCLVVITLGMFMVTTAGNIIQLSIWRVLTGLGIGGMLAAINAVTAEFSNRKKRNFSISLMVIGYPVGGVLGGMVASQLLAVYDWRAVFYFGSAMTALFLPLFYLYVPESPQWIAQKRPNDALKRINSILGKMKHQTIDRLVDDKKGAIAKNSGDIFSKTMLLTTLFVTAAYMFHVITFYFTIKWIPKIVVDMGFDASRAGFVLVWANVGGALGGALFGFLTIHFDLRRVLILTLLLSGVAVAVFGQAPEILSSLAFYAALAGFFSNAAMVGMYALCATVFPVHARGFGTGFVIGVGRAGSVLSPILAGILFQQGMDLAKVAMIMGVGSLLAMIFVFLVRAAKHSGSDSVPV